MSRGRLIANLLASLPFGWIVAFVALGNIKGECVLGEPCFGNRASEATLYAMVIASLVWLVSVVVFLRRN